MVFAVFGDYELKKVVKLAEKYFGPITANSTNKTRIAPKINIGESVIVQRPISQAHCMLGGAAYPAKHPHKYGLLLLNNLLGGMGMSSRLNLEIREKYGIAYTVRIKSYTTFSDTGIFSIYFGTDTEKPKKALRLVHKGIKKTAQPAVRHLTAAAGKTKIYRADSFS